MTSNDGILPARDRQRGRHVSARGGKLPQGRKINRRDVRGGIACANKRRAQFLEIGKLGGNGRPNDNIFPCVWGKMVINALNIGENAVQLLSHWRQDLRDAVRQRRCLAGKANPLRDVLLADDALGVFKVVVEMARLKPGAHQPDIASRQSHHKNASKKAEPAAHPQIAAAAATFLEYDNVIFAKKHVRKL